MIRRRFFSFIARSRTFVFSMFPLLARNRRVYAWRLHI